MPAWLRALFVAAAATAAAALVLRILPGWKEGTSERVRPRERSREDAIDDLTDAQKRQLVDELGRHV